MKQHIMGVHLRQYAYSCPICGEGYRRKKDMLLHMEQHKVRVMVWHYVYFYKNYLFELYLNSNPPDI